AAVPDPRHQRLPRAHRAVAHLPVPLRPLLVPASTADGLRAVRRAGADRRDAAPERAAAGAAGGRPVLPAPPAAAGPAGPAEGALPAALLPLRRALSPGAGKPAAPPSPAGAAAPDPAHPHRPDLHPRAGRHLRP